MGESKAPQRPAGLPVSIVEGIAAAAFALVGIAPHAAHASEVESGVLFYAEAQRVRLIEGTLTGRQAVGTGGQSLGFHAIFDALTGASPNGAAPSSQVQTFTSPSGGSSYTTPAGETPLNTTFHDTRVAGGASWEQPFSRLTKGSAGFDVSWETDYASLGFSGALSQDLFRRNTTIALGVSGSGDRIAPVGGVPVAGAPMGPPEEDGREGDDKTFAAVEDDDEREGGAGSSESKTTFESMVGITQILDRATLFQLNATRSRSSGYLTDPYKLVSVLDASGDPANAPIEYRFESRPSLRVKNALFGEMKHHFSRDVVDVSYRYLWDDWGVRSHTYDARYQWTRAGPAYWEPHLRYYRQSAADFYAPFLTVDSRETYFSGDYRLGEMTTYTAGLKRGWVLPNGHDVGIRAEYYEQRSTGPEPMGTQLELYPTVRSLIVQVDYALIW